MDSIVRFLFLSTDGVEISGPILVLGPVIDTFPLLYILERNHTHVLRVISVLHGRVT